MTKAVPGYGRIESLKRLKANHFNYLELYREARRKFGRVAMIYMPTRRYLVQHPDYARHILKDNYKNYVKSSDYDAMKPIVGDGLITSEGEIWKAQRPIVAPELALDAVKKQTRTFTQRTEDLLVLWKSRALDGKEFNLCDDMMKLTFQIAGEAFLGINVDDESDDVAKAFEEASDCSVHRMMSISLPMWVPTPQNLRFKRACKILHGMVDRGIKERIDKGGRDTDLMSRLLRSPTGKNKRLVRDEMITMILAGHETTSLALSWTLYLLSRHPDCYRQVIEESRRVLGGRIPTAEDLPKLTYTKMVIQESLRLFPPAAAVSRTPLKDDRVGDYVLTKGSQVSVAAGVIHLDPEFWPDPLKFDPERFNEENSKKIYPFSYLPFGIGPRICAGEQFAMVEATIILAMLSGRFRFVWNEKAVTQFPLITLRAKNGIWGLLKAAG